jgi:hypothetical protein
MANSPHEMFNRAVEANAKKDLRDQFAQAALVTLASSAVSTAPSILADKAWRIADEMMAQRDMTPEQREKRAESAE